MPEIQAFRGLRYDLGHVGSLSEVVAPPYDVISPEQQEQLYKRHPANVIRLILNRVEPGDDDQNNRYSRAAKFLKNWVREGVLKHEPDPAIYVYDQVFQYDGQEYTRRGFMARVRLQRFGEGQIYPHEETHAAAKADRLKLINACRANLSQIFGIYPDPDADVRPKLEAAIADKTPLEATDDLGVIHRLWAITDVKEISELTAMVGTRPIFVADGHHRYETACNFRDQLAEQGELDANHPANYVLMMFVSMNDPGMIVLPTHRLFRGLPELDSDQLKTRLSEFFECRLAGEGSDLAEMIWGEIELEDEQGTIGLFTAKDERWTVVRINEAGRQKMAELAPEHSEDWQGLGVSILHRLIVEALLETSEYPKPKYVHRVEEVIEALEGPEEFPLAALVMPASLGHVQAISEHGERMPAKSTYFYPKLLSGLVINEVS